MRYADPPILAPYSISSKDQWDWKKSQAYAERFSQSGLMGGFRIERGESPEIG
jgi:hypothetical protein